MIFEAKLTITLIILFLPAITAAPTITSFGLLTDDEEIC
jgi:hypothetical protein